MLNFYNINCNMKKNQKNIIKLLLLIMIFAITFLIIKDTYSKYLTMQDTNTRTSISKWHILLNDTDITENKDFSDFVELEFDSNEHTSANVIVPTSTGHMNLILESTGTELPYQYEISSQTEENALLPDFRIYGYSLNGDPIVELPADQTSIIGTITPPTNPDGTISDEEVKNEFILYVSWYDEDDNILDNYNDVVASKSTTPVATINLKVQITQLINTP